MTGVTILIVATVICLLLAFPILIFELILATISASIAKVVALIVFGVWIEYSAAWMTSFLIAFVVGGMVQKVAGQAISAAFWTLILMTMIDGKRWLYFLTHGRRAPRRRAYTEIGDD